MGRIWALLLAVLASAAACSWLPFISDDALISFRYAERAAHGLGLTWTNGERVEGYTDLLWVLLHIPAAWIGFDLLWWSRFLGIGGLILAVWCVGFAPGQSLSKARMSAALLVATCAPLTAWAVGGLEHTFLAGLLAAAFVAVTHGLQTQRWLPAGLLMAAIVLTRADGVVLVVALLAGIALLSLREARLGEVLLRMARVGSWPVVAWLGQTIFRRVYYGAWVPNTAVAKVSLNEHRLRTGLEWVGSGLTASWVLVLVAVVAVGLAIAASDWRRVAVPLITAVAWFSYVALVGGDIFPAWRQLVPGLLALGVVVAEGLQAAESRFGALSSIRWAVLTAALLAMHVGTQWTDPENLRANIERWEWDGRDLAHRLSRMTAESASPPLLAVDAAGALSFWSGLPSLDMLGLNDAWIPRHPPAGFGTGPIGHELGDGAYVLSRKPDLIAFCGACGAVQPCFVGGKQLVALPEFQRDYGLAFVPADKCVGAFWVRHADGPLASKKSADAIELTPWQMAARDEAGVSMGPQGRPEVKVDLRAPVVVELILPEGTWRVSDGGSLLSSWRCDGASVVQNGLSSALVVVSPTRVQLTVYSASPRTLAGLTLVRTDESPGWRCGKSGEQSSVRASSLSMEIRERDRWDRAGLLVFGSQGARIELDVAPSPELQFFTDNNDEYAVTWFADRVAIGSTVLPIASNGGGLTKRQVLRPPEATSLTLRATGDGSFSVGGLRGR